MLALETLPERDKDALRPAFPLRRWTTSGQLSKSFDRIKAAFGDRPAFLLPPDILTNPEDNDVAAELHALLEPSNGFAAWCSLFETEQAAGFVPALQLSDASQFDRQAKRLLALGRGAIVLLPRTAFAFAATIATRTAVHTDQGDGVTFLIDLGRQTRTLLLQEAELRGLGDRLLALCPKAHLAVSCSTFPDSFGGTKDQEIYERTLFQNLRAHFGNAIIYSDRGSARVEKGGGGGGVPYPRLDYPLNTAWQFFRTAAPESYKTGYYKIAKTLMDSDVWDPHLRLWGVQMIEKTEKRDPNGISSPARSTAVRINLHLHRQLWFDNPAQLYETDDDWSD